MTGYILRHVQVLVGSLGQLSRTPLATLLTVIVIGITLALPSGLYVAIDNLHQLTQGWDKGGQISLYLSRKLNDAAALKLAQSVREQEGVSIVEVTTRDQALAEFRKFSGFDSALTALDHNPLPAVLTVRPAPDATPSSMELLRARLARLPGVDLAEMDLAWMQRLHALLALAEEGVWMIAAFLAAAALLIVGNTIRLAVLNRQSEIEVTLLVGGTPAFVRRPFLYMGLTQGLLGGICAWLLVTASLLWLDTSVAELARLYGSGFTLSGLGIGAGLALVAIGGLLGWLAARVAAGWHLRQITK